MLLIKPSKDVYLPDFGSDRFGNIRSMEDLPPIFPHNRIYNGLNDEINTRFVNYLGYLVSDEVRLEILLATDSDLDLGLCGNQTNELMLIHKDAGLQVLPYWDGRLVWIQGPNYTYALLVEEEECSGIATPYLVPSLLEGKSDIESISKTELSELIEDGIQDPSVFYEKFADIINSTPAYPMDINSILPDHRDFKILDMDKFEEGIAATTTSNLDELLAEITNRNRNTPNPLEGLNFSADLRFN